MSTPVIDKAKIVANAIAWIEKALPSVRIMNIWDWSTDFSIQRRSSWSFKFDAILWGWLPKWRIIEIYGPESSWKTSMCLVAAAETTRNGWHVLFIDSEQALDVDYWKKMWIVPERFHIVQPDYGELAFNVLDWAVKSWAFDLIVVDSVPAMTPKAVIDWDAEDAAQIGLLARMMSKNLWKLTSVLGQSKDTTVIFINQERAKIGWFSMWYGELKETPGWKAMKFYTSIRVEVGKWAPINRWEDRIWNEVKLKTVKNKTTSPFQKTTLNLMFDEKGNRWWTDANQEVIDVVIEKDLLGSRWRFVSLTWEKIKSWEVEINGVMTKLDWKEMLAYYLIQPENKEELEFLKNAVLTWVTELERNEDETVVWFNSTKKIEKKIEEKVEEKETEEKVD